MKKRIQEWDPRRKAKARKTGHDHDVTTGPSTSAGAYDPADAAPPLADQTLSSPRSERAEPSSSMALSGSASNPVQSVVPIAERAQTYPLAPEPGPVPTSRAGRDQEVVSSHSSAEYVQAQAEAGSSLTEGPGDLSTPAMEQTPVAASTRSKKRPGQFISGIKARIKADGLENLKGLLDAVGQAAAFSGWGPIKEVAEGLAQRLEVLIDAGQGRQEYEEMQKKLERVFEDLKQYSSSSPLITMSVESICGSIRKEMENLKTRLDEPTIRKGVKAEGDEDTILECFERIADHLQRLSRNANMSTWKIVDELATENRIQKLAPSMWPCYNSEKATALERRACTRGTRVDVLAQIHQWARRPSPGNVYWINGMAGTGKTTIAYSLCQQLDEGADRLLCASFFCSRSLPECRDVGRIIPSIAYQLARHSRPFRFALSQAMEKDPDAHARSPNTQFERLIKEPLSNAQVRGAMPVNMVVVIDALDECDDIKSTELILNVLLTGSRNLPVKFVVSSRPEAVIREQMEEGMSHDSGVVLHELDSGEVKTDIKTYLKEELAPAKPRDSDVEKLVERAGVLFIYAATVVRYVGSNGFRRNPQARLKTVLGVSGQRGQVQTKPIDDLYGAILRAAIKDDELEQTDREDMRLILNTVICAKTPLTVDALNGLLQLGDVERVQSALSPLWSILHVMEPNMMVTTLHASFPDYLTTSDRAGPDWYCDTAAHNRVLAEKCFEYIRDTKPQFNICRLPSSFLDDADVEDIDTRVTDFIPPELRYACQYWSAHLAASDVVAASKLSVALDQFLTTNLLLWMEVMNLTKNISAAPGNLLAAKRWAMAHSPPRELLDLMNDAMRFANTLMSSPVAQITPHIYVSMLPFLPSYSPIRKHYAHRMQGLTGVHGTALDREKPVLARWPVRHGDGCSLSADGNLLAIGPGRYAKAFSLIDTSTGRSVREIPFGKNAKVTCSAISSNGTRLAFGTTSYVGFVDLVWALDVTGRQPLLGPIRGHKGVVYPIVFSNDGTHIISGSRDRTIRVWDARSGECVLGPLAGHTDAITCISISPDDKLLISGSRDTTIRLWDMESGDTVRQITGYTHPVVSIGISPGGLLIIFGSKDGTVGVLDARTGELRFGLFKHNSRPLASIAVSPDGAYISTMHWDHVIQTWEVSTGKLFSTLTLTMGYSTFMKLRYSTDGSRLVLYTRGHLELIDTQSAAVASGTLPGHTESILSINFSPDGKHIVSGSKDNSVCVWDPITGELIHGPMTGHTKEVHLVRYSRDGSRILSCSGDGTLCQWDAQTGTMYEVENPNVDPFLFKRDSESGFSCATYSPAGDLIATISWGRDVSIWDSGNGKLIREPIKTGNRHSGLCIAFCTDSNTLITGWSNGAVQIWDVQSGQLIFSHQPQYELAFLTFAFSPDCLYAIMGGEKTLLQLSAQITEPFPGSFSGHPDRIRAVQYSSDGTHIVSGSVNNTVHIWDAQTGNSVFGPLRGHTCGVSSVAYSPDGTYVASASDDKTIRIWNVTQNDTLDQAHASTFPEWVLNGDGWVVNEQTRKLIWVPLHLRDLLLRHRNTMLISREGYVRLDFTGALIGEEWNDCGKGF